MIVHGRACSLPALADRWDQFHADRLLLSNKRQKPRMSCCVVRVTV